MKREIVADRKGAEYAVTKKSRVNWQITRLSDGAQLIGPGAQFTHLRWEDLEVNNDLQIGVVVKVESHEGKFVIFAYGTGLNEFKVIRLGGSLDGKYMKKQGELLTVIPQ